MRAAHEAGVGRLGTLPRLLSPGRVEAPYRYEDAQQPSQRLYGPAPVPESASDDGIAAVATSGLRRRLAPEGRVPRRDAALRCCCGGARTLFGTRSRVG